MGGEFGVDGAVSLKQGVCSSTEIGWEGEDGGTISGCTISGLTMGAFQT